MKETTVDALITDSSSPQFDLFKRFVTNDTSEVSNTVELWESIPKYILTPAQVKKLRNADGLAKPFKWEYQSGGKVCRVEIAPALIEQSDGRYLACFPGVTEELIEEALKKILTEQRQGFHDPAKATTRVRFTLRMIQRELKKRGRARSIVEVKRGIEIMSKCSVKFERDDGKSYSGNILSELYTVGLSSFRADNNAQHAARLPSLITDSIERLEFRQFNYMRLMTCDTQLARWIYKRLINRFKQADMMNDYHFMYSAIKQPSGLLQQARERDNRAKVVEALDELVRCDVLRKYKKEERREGRTVVDVKYTVMPTVEFIREQKAANKRNTMNMLNN